MDDFKKAGARSIGPGGIKCNCCFDYHTFGNHKNKLSGFSKLRRTRLKQLTDKEIINEIKCLKSNES